MNDIENSEKIINFILQEIKKNSIRKKSFIRKKYIYNDNDEYEPFLLK